KSTCYADVAEEGLSYRAVRAGVDLGQL
ncbi:hypothetical protein A2U01_0081494, partial [Trifolium medium]|nr:hypothetical protein [Trifolium medium]